MVNVRLAIDKAHTVPQRTLDCGPGLGMLILINVVIFGNWPLTHTSSGQPSGKSCWSKSSLGLLPKTCRYNFFWQIFMNIILNKNSIYMYLLRKLISPLFILMQFYVLLTPWENLTDKRAQWPHIGLYCYHPIFSCLWRLWILQWWLLNYN